MSVVKEIENKKLQYIYEEENVAKDYEVNFIIVEKNANLYPIEYISPYSCDKLGVRQGFSLFLIIFLVIIGGFSVGVGMTFGQVLFIPPSGTQYNITTAISRVKPSVVLITSENETLLGGTSSSSGTGIIFYGDSNYIFIVTNEHVIANAFEIEIMLERGQVLNASLVGRSFIDDLAILKVSWDDLERVGVSRVTMANFANSNDVMIGDIAIALGNALGQGVVTTTLGIIGALDMQLRVENRILNVMQTDAAINPGNSGGPLINTSGEVVGINTVKLSVDNVYGMGYSITSNHAMPIMEMILRGEAQPRIGIQGLGLAEANRIIIQNYNISIEEGVFISRVFRHTPSYYANLERGNVITHIDDEQIKTINGLIEVLAENRIGDEVVVTVYKSGYIYEVYLILAP